MSEKTSKAHRGQVMRTRHVSSVVQLVLLSEKVRLTAPQGLSPPDQSPISSITLPHYILHLRDDSIFD
jgi:hypothetical protein